MNIEELEEELSNILVAGFKLSTDKNGQLIIQTGLRQDEDGELSSFDDDEEDLNIEEDVESEFDPDLDASYNLDDDEDEEEDDDDE